jgi:hypothetical protein
MLGKKKESGNRRRRAERLRKAEGERLAFAILLRPPKPLSIPPLIKFLISSGYETTPSSRPTLVNAAMA